MTDRPLVALLAPFAALCMLLAAAGAWAFPPPLPVDLTDDAIEVLPEADPAELRSPGIEEAARTLLGALREGGPRGYDAWREALDRSTLPLIAREAVLLLAVESMLDSGDAGWITALEQIAGERAEARYRDRSHRHAHFEPWFDYPRAARMAARQLTSMEAERVARARFREEDAPRFENLDDVAVFAGTVVAAASIEEKRRSQQVLRSLAEEGVGLSRLHLPALAQVVWQGGVREFFADPEWVLSLDEDATQLRHLLRPWNALRDGETAEWFRYWNAAGERADVRAILLTLLQPADAEPEVLTLLVGLLGDGDLGGNAALALRRIAPQEARERLAALLEDDSVPEAALRRALLTLRRDDSPEARAALARFVERTDGAPVELQREAARWLER